MSISLPAAIQTIVNVGGVVIETASHASVTAITIDYVAQALICTVKQGMTTGQKFSPGRFPPVFTFTINYITGAWLTSSGLSGTASPVALATMKTVFLSFRNSAEVFAVGQTGLFPGASHVPWTAL